jgi:hypothetical protein
VVGVLVGVKHSLDAVDVGLEQLLAQIAAGVDEDASRRCLVAGIAFEQQRATSAAVLWIVWIANAPMAANARHPAGRAAT